jgi:molybdopterin-guanine dinucleotide biosynthesis adapter protein
MSLPPIAIPVLGFVAPSGSGKTTLIRKLLPILKARGLRIGYLKHAHHTFDLDRPGKDSFEIRAAGADATLLASRERWALQVECRERAQDPNLWAMLGRFPAGTLDLVLAEGFKHAAYPKIEVYRAALGQPPLYPGDTDILAVATDCALPAEGPPILPLSRPETIAQFILDHPRFSLPPHGSAVR